MLNRLYREITSKIGNYLDTVIFQIDHMTNDFIQNMTEYSKLSQMVELRFNKLVI